MSETEFYRHHLKNTQEIADAVQEIYRIIEAVPESEAAKSAKSHQAYLDFIKDFHDSVCRYHFPTSLEKGWGYAVTISENGCSIWLECTDLPKDQIDGLCLKVEEDDNDFLIFESYELVSWEPKKLTVEEYALLHEVQVGTVRQWIRRAKLREVTKFGNEWRIPEFLEPETGKYEPCSYAWEETLTGLPAEYAFLNDFDEVSIEQVQRDLYRVGITGKKGAKILKMTEKEREKFELMLISNPGITCVGGYTPLESLLNWQKNYG